MTNNDNNRGEVVTTGAQGPSESARVQRIAQSVGAIVAGLLATVIPSIATDALMHVTEVFPPIGQSMDELLFVLALVYRVVYAVAGGYVTAWLAPARRVGHAVVLGAIGFVASIAGAVKMWDMGPAWYPIALIVTAIPSTWLGGWLGVRSARA
jgi:hypothetical protein